MSTIDAMRELKVSYWFLIGAIRAGRIPPPAKTPGGDFIWGRRDINAVKRLITPSAQERVRVG